MNKAFLNGIIKRVFFALILLVGALDTFAQCPAPPATCTYTVTSTSNQTAFFNVGNNQTVCVLSGTFTGSLSNINPGAEIYVAPGATFTPTGMGDLAGSVLNCGTSVLPGFNIGTTGPGDSARIDNYGKITLAGSIGPNNKSAWFNHVGGSMTFNNGFTLNNTYFQNWGNILMKSTFTMNSGVNRFVNHDSITTLGAINLNAGIVNDGFLFAKGSNMTLNAQGNITNGCFFISDGDFNYSGSDTLIVTGLSWVTGSSALFKIQGNVVRLSDSGFVQGANFEDNSTPVLGSGNFYFSGNTKNQGTIYQFGRDKKGLNFYDASLVPPPFFPTQRFDQEIALHDPSVTRNPITPKDNNYVPNTCSDLIKKQFCDVNAGADFSTCGATADLVDAKTGQLWKFLKGPSAATPTINATTGVIGGMTAAGTYYFVQYKPALSTCGDTIIITRVSIDQTLTVKGDTVCSTAGDIPVVTIPNAQANVMYEVHLTTSGGTLLGSGSRTTVGTLTINLDKTKLPASPSNSVVYVTATAPFCGTLTLNNQANIGINTNPTLTLAVIGDTICSNTAGNPFVTIVGAEANVVYTAHIGSYTGTVVGNGSRTTTGNLNVTVNKTLLPAAPSNSTIYLTATINGCGTQNLTNLANIGINTNPTLTLAVVGDTICSNSANPFVTITGAEANVVYTARLGSYTGTVVGTGSRTTTGSLTVTINKALLPAAPSNSVIYLTATINGCGTQNLNNKANIGINTNPTLTLVVTGDTICSNTAGNPFVAITGAEANVVYTAHLGSYTGTVVGTGSRVTTGTLNVTINKALLPSAPSNSVIYLTATINGCGTQNLSNLANIGINANPTLTLAVVGDTICSNSGNPFVTITGAEANVVYTAHLGSYTGTVVGTGSRATTGSLTVTINKTLLPAAPSNSVIYLTATINGCGTQNLNNKANIGINTNPTLTLAVVGDTICSDAAGNPFVTITGAEANVVYTAHLGSYTGTVVGTGSRATTGTLNVTINKTLLPAAPSNSVIYLTATINGCGTQNLANQASIGINTDPTLTLAVVGDTICSNTAGNPFSTITGAEANVVYTAHLGSYTGTIVGTGSRTTTGTLTVTINKALLPAAPSNSVIYFTATINGCGTQNLANKANIGINANPTLTLAVVGDTICSNAGSPFVTITGAEANVVYTAHVGSYAGTAVGSGSRTTTGTLTLTLNKALLPAAPSNSVIYLTATINGCGTQNLANQANVGINSNPTLTLVVMGDTICSTTAGNPFVAITGAEPNVIYTAHLGSYTGTIVGSGSRTTTGTLNVTIDKTFLPAAPSNSVIYFTATINGCGTQNLANQANIGINSDPILTLAVRGDTVCSTGANPVAAITGANANVVYTAHLGSYTGTVVGTGSRTTTGTLNIPITKSLLPAAPSNSVIYFTATINGCGTQNLVNKANIGVNKDPNLALAVIGDTICSTSGNPVAVISGAEANVVYTAHLGSYTGIVVGSGSRTTTGALNVTIDKSLLPVAPSNSVIYFTATINGCGTQNLVNKANIGINSDPTLTLDVVGDTICSTSGNPFVTVIGAEANVVYTAHLGSYTGTVVGSASRGTAGDLNITITKTLLPVAPSNSIIYFTATINGCGTQNLANQANVGINSDPTLTLAVVGDTICSTSGNLSVQVMGAEAGVVYTAHLGSYTGAVLGSGSRGTKGTLSIVLNKSLLGTAPTFNVVYFTATINGCGTQNLANHANVGINSDPVLTLDVLGDTVCSNAGTPTATILNAEANVVYTARLGSYTGIIVGSNSRSTAGNLVITLNRALLPVAPSNSLIYFTATINGCGTQNLANQANVGINPLPDSTLSFSSTGPICVGGLSHLTIFGAEKGVTYTILDNGTPIDTMLGKGKDVSKDISLKKAGLRTITIIASINGCSNVALKNNVKVQVNVGPNINLGVSADTVVCQGSPITVKIAGSDAAVFYKIFDGSEYVGDSANGNGGTLSLVIDSLPSGTYLLRVRARTAGCGILELKDSAVVKVNPKPSDANLQAFGDVVCSNTDSASVTLKKTQKGVVYQAILKGQPIGSPKASPNDNAIVVLRLPVSKLALDSNVISFSGTIGGCGTVYFNRTAVVIKNKLPGLTGLSLLGDTICSTTDSAHVQVRHTEKGVQYQAVLNGVPIGSSVTSTATNSVVTLVIERSSLQEGSNFLHISEKIDGCGEVISSDSVNVIVNRLPNVRLKVAGDTVCSNSAFADFVIKNTSKGDIFQAYWKKAKIGQPDTSSSDSSDLTLKIPVSTLGVGSHFISATVSIPGCATAFLKDSALIVVNQLPNSNPTVIGDTICDDSTVAQIRLIHTQKDVTYNVFKGIGLVGTGLAKDTVLTIDINAVGFSTGSNLLNITANIAGCAKVNATQANVYVNPRPPYDLDFSATGPICFGGLSTVTIKNATKGVLYAILDEGTLVDTLYGKGKDASKEVALSALGLQEIRIRASIRGCSDGLLDTVRYVQVNQGPDISSPLETNSPVCQGNPVVITVVKSEKGVMYKIFDGVSYVGDSLKGNGDRLDLTIDSLSPGEHLLHVRARTEGCGIVQLKDSAIVKVQDKLEAGLKVIGDTVCSNSTEADIRIAGTKTGQIYKAYLNGTFLNGDTVKADGWFDLTVPVKGLQPNLNKVNLTAFIQGCGSINLADSASILVNPLPSDSLAVTDDTVCRNSATASIRILGTMAGQTYTAYLNGSLPLDTIVSTSTETVLTIPVSKLPSGSNKVNIRAFVKGCDTVNLKDTAMVLVNELPSDSLKVIGDTVCSGRDFAHLTIKSTLKDQVFQAYDQDGKVVGKPKKSTGGDVVLDIPILGSFEKGFYQLTIKATIRGCDSTTLRDKGDLLIGDAPKPSLPVIGDTVCTNSDTATVRIIGTKAKEAYVARLNGVTVSDSVISAGDTVTLKIPTALLPSDTNEITIYTNVVGCGETALSNKAWVIINKLPEDSMSVVGDTICENATEALVKIRNTEKNVVYTAWLNGVKISDPVLSAGGDVFLHLPIGKLSLDLNKIGFLASIHGCADVPLKDSAQVIVNKKPTTSLNLEGATVCSNADTAIVKILGTDKGVVYQALLNKAPLGQPVVGTGQDIVLKLPVAGLSLDTNSIAISVEIKGCSNDTLDKAASVIVHKLPSDTLSTQGSTVCKNAANATVTVFHSEKLVGYQAFVNNDSVGPVTMGTGGTIQLTVSVSKLAYGENKVVVRTSLEQCNVVTLKDTALVIVNGIPNADSTLVDGSSVCSGQDGFAVLNKTQPGILYTLYVNGQVTTHTIVGTGKSDTLNVPASLLYSGANPISFAADIAACSEVMLSDKDNIYVLYSPDFNVTGDRLLCYGGIGNYTTTGMAGALSYQWIVWDSAAIVSGQGTQQIQVQFDSLTSYVKVVPVGSFGACYADSSRSLQVQISAPVSDTARFLGKDTVCVGTIDTIQVYGQKGTAGYAWKVPDGVEVLDTLYSKNFSNSDSLVVRYLRPGNVTFVFYPYSYCAQAFVDSVTKTVRVISYPVAVASDVDAPTTTALQNSVTLDGLGSTVGDSIAYHWSSEKGVVAQILNPDSLMHAVLTSSANEVKVYLTLTNVGKCPSIDSAIVKLSYDIIIPNVFSPNNDGTHDTWEIRNISKLYPNAIVEIFNQWGSFIWKSDPGYPIAWDGKRNGEDMPVATYYYVIDKKDGNKPKASSITIIR